MTLFSSLLSAYRRAGADNVSLLAAGVAFYAFLALVPMLAALVLTYGLFADPAQAAEHARVLTDLLPADAAGIVNDQLLAVASGDAGKTALGLLVALGTAFYGASKGGKALLVALNIVEGVEENRAIVRQTLAALAITAAAIGAAVVALAAISFLGFAEAMLPGLPGWAYSAMRWGLWIAFAIGAVLSLAALYARAPNRDARSVRGLLPGALLGAVAVLVATLGFAIYVAQFGSYNATYGALGAVVILQLWLYLSAFAILLGAEYNLPHDDEGAATP